MTSGYIFTSPKKVTTTCRLKAYDAYLNKKIYIMNENEPLSE